MIETPSLLGYKDYEKADIHSLLHPIHLRAASLLPGNPGLSATKGLIELIEYRASVWWTWWTMVGEVDFDSFSGTESKEDPARE
ncbi:MAG: hypothetical protein ACYDHX_14510 [Methanothrix sp.]